MTDDAKPAQEVLPPEAVKTQSDDPTAPNYDSGGWDPTRPITRGNPPRSGMFKRGHPGSKIGNRRKLGEAFLKDLHQLWTVRGSEVLVTCLEKDPVAFCRMVASLMPRDIHFHMETLDELPDDELDRRIDRLLNAINDKRRRISAGDADGTDDAAGSEEQPAGPQPAGDVPSVH